MTELADRLHSVQSDIADAIRDAGRSPDGVTTIVITKFHPASLVRELAGLGIRDVGENRQQDAGPKAVALGDLDLRWHFVGQLQTNKVRAVLEFASDIQSVDRPSLVRAIAAADASIDIFLQLNLTDDHARGGVSLDGLEELAVLALGQPGLTLRGVMAVAPLDEDPRSAFARVRAASERMRTVAPEATGLSMGMSADFREAILEGATHLRIGTAITGKRPPAS
jgi:pyridoxal phosphate enzyme (YggS family)